MIYTCPLCGLGMRLDDKNISNKGDSTQVVEITYNCGAILHLLKQGIYWTKTVERTCKNKRRYYDE